MPPRHHQHLEAAAVMQKAYWEKGCAWTSPSTSSTYVMMIRWSMHAPLSIKKVMSMLCVCMQPLTILIKKYLSTPSSVSAPHASGHPPWVSSQAAAEI